MIRSLQTVTIAQVHPRALSGLEARGRPPGWLSRDQLPQNPHQRACVPAYSPRIVDAELLEEWQVAPELWNQVCRAVDAADRA